MTTLLIIFTVWIMIGLFSMLAESEDYICLSYTLLTLYFIFVPFVPWVLHMYGLF